MPPCSKCCSALAWALARHPRLHELVLFMLRILFQASLATVGTSHCSCMCLVSVLKQVILMSVSAGQWQCSTAAGVSPGRVASKGKSTAQEYLGSFSLLWLLGRLHVAVVVTVVAAVVRYMYCRASMYTPHHHTNRQGAHPAYCGRQHLAHHML
jgi:hypothetical protein